MGCRAFQDSRHELGRDGVAVRAHRTAPELPGRAAWAAYAHAELCGRGTKLMRRLNLAAGGGKELWTWLCWAGGPMLSSVMADGFLGSGDVEEIWRLLRSYSTVSSFR